MRALMLVVLLACSNLAKSEVYQGITASSSLGDIKKRFPNATITKVQAAWVTAADGFYLMTGMGLSGSVYLAFKDPRPMFAELVAARESEAMPLRRLADSNENAAQLKDLEQGITSLNVFAKESDDDALFISWVRWVPISPIPIERFISKYGVPTRTDFDDNTMEPYSFWTNRQLSTKLSDDKKRVLVVDYGFTPQEKTTGCRAKFGSKSPCVFK